MRSRHKKGTQQTEALGRSRGGFTTKLHARCDAKGRPLVFVLTGGEAHDIKGFAPLLRMTADKIEALLADKGYDADAIREELAKAEIEAVIPAKRNRKDPAPHIAEIQVVQPDRAAVQQAQELAARRHQT
ncbi:transposase [Mesorhizobium hawassense]|uniref:transposase n=1 Tax=Mesorhizobium hawassense TaxID=1209954 RepID=UPI001FE1DEB2|nr:transposase [Mesorhizobium hawassense]